MDIETAIETCLIQNSPIRAKDLKLKLEQRGYSVSRSQFYRYGAKLKKAGKLEQTNGIWRWCQNMKIKGLWEPAPRDSLLNDFSKAGASLIDVEVEKYQSGSKLVIQGVIVLRGAKKLQDAIKMYVPDEYDAFLFTEASLDKYDMLTWQGTKFIVRKIEDIYDVYSLSYRIAKLVKPPCDVEPAWVFGG
jgi:hypothetical protein